jgi:MFS family permease
MLFQETIVTKLDLVCGDESKQKLLGTLLMLGILFGSMIGGRVSDRFGRKKCMFGSLVVLAPAVTAAAFSGTNALIVKMASFLPHLFFGITKPGVLL